jgi:pyrroline-5-carboxylate reductase
MATDATRFGFIGAGKMATALAQGWISAGLISHEHCVASDPMPASREQFIRATGAKAATDNRQVVTASDILILAVKPQNMVEVLQDIHCGVTTKHLVVSIAAGISLARLAEGLGPNQRLIRVMPNVACLVQAGAAGYAAGKHATSDDVATIDRLFNAVGRAFAVPESLLDAVTGLSGSGPAFVYSVIEALRDGGVSMGLPHDVATMLAAQTVFGAAKMALESDVPLSALKDQVISPGGTTIEGLRALEQGGLRAAMMDAVAAATRRALELGSTK